MKKGARINEWDAAEELTKYRKEGKYFRGVRSDAMSRLLLEYLANLQFLTFGCPQLAYDNISATNENAGEFAFQSLR